MTTVSLGLVDEGRSVSLNSTISVWMAARGAGQGREWKREKY